MKSINTDNTFQLKSPEKADTRKQRKQQRPSRFRRETSAQLDPMVGAPEWQVPEGHLARVLRAFVYSLDLGAHSQPRSGLGRPAVDRRNYLAILLYASIIGVHSMTRVAALLVTDAAFRLLSGGLLISASALAAYRRESGAVFDRVLSHTIERGLAEGFIDPQELAIDGMRLRANASTKAMRTRERSERRLRELAGADVEAMTGEERSVHDAKVAKHGEAVKLCDERGVTSVCVTNEMAALMKFPDGGRAPGHRIVAAVAGQKERLLVGLVVNSAPTDYGQLEGVATDARTRLEAAGLPKDTPLRGGVDCGFLGEEDQKFIVEQRARFDIVVPPPVEGTRKNGDVEMFKRTDFTRTDDGVTCPAGAPMRAPTDTSQRKQIWTGQGCESCPVKIRCTKAKVRRFEVDLDREAIHKSIIERYETADGQEFYKRRMSTVEPVFSVLETDMMFIRASSRLPKTIVAETLLKCAAYNARRLLELVAAKEAAGRKPDETLQKPKRRHWRNKANCPFIAKHRPVRKDPKSDTAQAA